MKTFNEIYENVYKECNVPLEKMRKEIKKRNIIVFTICLTLGIILAVETKPIMFSIIALILTAIIALILTIIISSFSKKNREYTNLFKDKVVKTFIKEYNKDLNYEPNEGISSTIYSQGEFEYYDRYHSEDYIYGILKDGYRIDMAEAHTVHESTDSDGNATYTTIFHGLFARIEFNKFVNGTIKIRKNILKLFDSKKRLEMDSGEFEKIYDVYSDDKIVAMQLLTSDIMQMFIDFKKENKITPELTIKRNNLYIRFATGNIFEANIMKKSLDYKTLKKYYDTINFTLDITEKMLKNIKETET